MFNYSAAAEKECKVRGITFETITDGAANALITEIQNPSANMNVVKLLNAPKIAVYSPKTKQPWDDAVTLVLTYAEIPYDIVFDDEVRLSSAAETTAVAEPEVAAAPSVRNRNSRSSSTRCRHVHLPRQGSGRDRPAGSPCTGQLQG
jgi:hypothetical protein